ncbi:MAG: glycerophosphodiester phosphodiesterase [Anaerolineae bacterium]|jgi:glycerophosphoryl diester phosphodiesterase|nr:glycerophosphodiester phosphodiesterase [Anaerolineae bacterium]
MSAKTIIEAMYRGRTLVFGHRGASAYAPMNTIPAFELARKQGADGIELDVHRSKDGHVVVLHDFSVDGTTNGVGDISQMTLAQLKSLDAGAWFHPSFANTHIPTLEEVFLAVGRHLFINIEIKSRKIESDGLEGLVANLIHTYGMKERVIVSSFNPHVLMRFRGLYEGVPLGYLTAPDELFPKPDSFSFEAHHPYQGILDEAHVAKYKTEAPFINTWTVNEPTRAVELAKMGVNGLITDKPDEILRAIGR